MRIAILLILTSLYAGLAPAAESCQALADRLSSTFSAAHLMSPLDKQAKCLAYARVTLDMDSVVVACQDPKDMAIVTSKIQPIAVAIGEDEEKYCGM